MNIKTKLMLLVSCLFVLFSCSSDDDAIKQNDILFKVYSNSKESVITVSGTGVSPLRIKDKWERKFKSDALDVGMNISCEDVNTLLIGEIYINGKLVRRKEGNIRVTVSATTR